MTTPASGPAPFSVSSVCPPVTDPPLAFTWSVTMRAPPPMMIWLPASAYAPSAW